MDAGAVTMLPPDEWAPFKRIPLWKAVTKPEGWDKLSQPSQVSKALILMTEWLWKNKQQCVSILIFVAGKSEVLRLRHAMLASTELRKVSWAWDVYCLWGGCSRSVESQVRHRMDEHEFKSNAPALFLILTAGKGKDGWKSNANGIIICSEETDMDHLGFLQCEGLFLHLPIDNDDSVAGSEEESSRSGYCAGYTEHCSSDNRFYPTGTKWPRRQSPQLLSGDERDQPNEPVANKPDSSADGPEPQKRRRIDSQRSEA